MRSVLDKVMEASAQGLTPIEAIEMARDTFIVNMMNYTATMQELRNNHWIDSFGTSSLCARFNVPHGFALEVYPQYAEDAIPVWLQGYDHPESRTMLTPINRILINRMEFRFNYKGIPFLGLYAIKCKESSTEVNWKAEELLQRLTSCVVEVAV